jgi:hypothetical protein
MMTALILCEDDPETLATTLSALVPAVVEGLMGDAVVIVRHADAAVAEISEIAGASLAVVPPDADPWRAGVRLARRDWLLCLQSGDVPGEGWMRAVDRFLVAAARGGQPLGRFARRDFGPTALLRLAERVTGTRMVRAGDLVRRDWLALDGGARVRPVRIAARIEREGAR